MRNFAYVLMWLQTCYAHDGLDPRYRPPEDSSLRHVVVALHGVYVDDDYISKFQVFERYRPYFLDLFYIQMRADVSTSEFFLPDGGSQLNLSQKTQRTFDCGAHRFPSETYDTNSYACMAELIPRVLSRAQDLYEEEPVGFLFLHADFFISPRFTIGKDTASIWTAGYRDAFWNPVTLEELAAGNVEDWSWWKPWQNSTLEALTNYIPAAGLRSGIACGGWSDMYYVPRSVVEKWISLQRHFVKYDLMIEIAIPIAHVMLSDLARPAEIPRLAGATNTHLTIKDIDDVRADAGHKVNLESPDVRHRMEELFLEDQAAKVGNSKFQSKFGLNSTAKDLHCLHVQSCSQSLV